MPDPGSHPHHPTRQDVDIFGMCHLGLVRKENQDHFLVASLHKSMQLHQTTLPNEGLGSLVSGARGYVFLVADGVGSTPWGEQASGSALRAIADYVIHGMDVEAMPDEDHDHRMVDRLRRSVEHGHQAIKDAGEAEGKRGMATTLTMVTIHWPRAYVIHVGDSRGYRLRQGVLTQVTKDQTMAQAMIDAGALTPAAAEQSRLKHILWSALGGKEATPEVTTLDCEWEDVMLLCSDGLTKHVSDEEIRQELLRSTSAEQSCHALIDLALSRGGSDNVTVVIGRLRGPRPA
ncbi:MAG TPA: protein phosphatase 2C domain-containing protein [Gemmatimonadales bacterium]|nr:protein phosphatase 2C domain-containing protein [Gemmatimonadales bacterium]